jgi:hypothetical protein
MMTAADITPCEAREELSRMKKLQFVPSGWRGLRKRSPYGQSA